MIPVQYAQMQTVCAKILQMPEIVGVKSFVHKDNLVISVLTTPIYLKSERAKLADQIRNTASQDFAGKIIVSYDIAVYRKTHDEMTDNEKESLLSKLSK